MSKLIVFDGQSCPTLLNRKLGTFSILILDYHTICVDLPVLQGSVLPATDPRCMMHITTVTVDGRVGCASVSLLPVSKPDIYQYCQIRTT